MGLGPIIRKGVEEAAKRAGPYVKKGAEWAGKKAKEGLDAAKKWWKGDKKKKKKDEQCPTGKCNNTPEDLTKDAKPGRKTKGKTEQFEKTGGKDQMNKDFDSLGAKDVKTVQTPKGELRTGTLPDGRVVTSRPFSSDGRPTLEIRNPSNGRGVEIRYD
jgi:hypothetical protein